MNGKRKSAEDNSNALVGDVTEGDDSCEMDTDCESVEELALILAGNDLASSAWVHCLDNLLSKMKRKRKKNALKTDS